jgi:uncharacterized integral membrane protein (TIGR00698 family)
MGALPAARWAGLALVGLLAAVSLLLAAHPALQSLGLGALTLAIVLGILVGNTVFPAIAVRTHAGVEFAKSSLLRAGIVLYGFRVTFQEFASVGWAGAAIAVAVVVGVFLLATQLGTRVFKLDLQTSMLIGAGSAICGAAAVMATAPVLRAPPHKVTVAMATVLVFGTLGMFAYPLLYPYLGLSEHDYGVFAGSTIHEVAQVVVAGRSVSEAAGAAAVIEKMIRVMLLAPFLLILSGFAAGSPTDPHESRLARLKLPWFALMFVAVSGFNSLQLLPPLWVEWLLWLDTLLLAMAMAALGLCTQARALREAGLKPMLLGASLFAALFGGGYALNRGIVALLG